jgi:ketosteroid isomerase-like protein
MSEENVEIVRRAYEAVRQRNFDAFLGLHDAKVQLTPLRPEGATYHGHEGVRKYWEELFDVFPDFSAEINEIRNLGDLVFVAAHIRGRGMGSDVPVEQPIWQLGEIRGGRVIWWRSYPSEAEALEAAGLRE